ncbi:MAG: hypothetical protein HY926_07120 [Elusimicrobia bacterium]|nr:hypothetical protein [Elusimicrobiota bacterium]
MSAGGLRRLWARTWSEARAATEAVLLPAGLFLLYFVGLGLTAALARLLRAEVMGDGSSWSPAAGYEPGAEDCLRQS